MSEPRTARATDAARAVAARRRHEKWAEEMREWGWGVTAPEDVRAIDPRP